MNLLKSLIAFRPMITLNKKIPVFFLFFAAVVFYAHMIIPHDHHFAEFDVCQERPRPVPGKPANHHKGFPAHCHAFNDLASEKAIIYTIVTHIKSVSSDPVSIYDVSDSVLSAIWIRVFVDSKLAVNSGLLKLSSLRAPPSVS